MYPGVLGFRAPNPSLPPVGCPSLFPAVKTYLLGDLHKNTELCSGDTVYTKSYDTFNMDCFMRSSPVTFKFSDILIEFYVGSTERS